MDFGDLFWIIPVIYVLKRVFFGARKPETAKRPPAREPQQPELQRAMSQKNREDFREALGMALGFPASMMEEEGNREGSVEIADYRSGSSMPFDAERGRGRNADIDHASLFPMDPAPEEVAEYDPWHERSVPETSYEADPLFAEEEAFETGESDQTRNHDDDKPEAAVEALSPYEHPEARGHSLRQIVAHTSLQEALVMKELLDRPVSLRRRSGSPFKN